MTFREGFKLDSPDRRLSTSVAAGGGVAVCPRVRRPPISTARGNRELLQATVCMPAALMPGLAVAVATAVSHDRKLRFSKSNNNEREMEETICESG